VNDLNVVHAGQLVTVADRGRSRAGAEQGRLDAIDDGAVAIRSGRIVAVGPTDAVLSEWDDGGVRTIDAAGRTVLPGLVECHSHPLFGGERCHEYAERLGGASLAEVAARGGGIWSSVLATRACPTDVLERRLDATLARVVSGGATTVEVKSGYGLTTDHELEQLRLLDEARHRTPIRLVITFLGAHVVPRDLVGDPAGDDAADRYVDLVGAEMLPAVLGQGIARFHDITVEAGLFSADQARRLMDVNASAPTPLPVRVHADAWAPSRGWATAVGGGAVSAEHLTYTPADEIDEVGPTDCVAVLLPVAELVYMTERRADARRFVETGVPLAIATDHCSSIHATSLLATATFAAPWYRLTPAEVIVAVTLNAAYALGVAAECGSLDVGKAGDLVLVDAAHPDELFLAHGAPLLDEVVIGGRVVRERLDLN